jgi:hypothetical protein
VARLTTVIASMVRLIAVSPPYFVTTEYSGPQLILLSHKVAGYSGCRGCSLQVVF